MNLPRLLRGVARVGAGLAGLGAFAVFAMAALQDHTATATTAAGLCIALAVLSALDLESFEGLGIKAKLRTTLSDAEARLNALDGLIRSLSRSAFVQVARGNFLIAERREMISELTQSLQTAGVASEVIEVLKRPFYSFAATRLWYVATSVRANYISQRLQAIESEKKNLPPGVDRERLILEYDKLLRSELGIKLDINNYKSFVPAIERIALETPISDPTHELIFRSTMKEISNLFEECLSTGNIPDHADEAMGVGGPNEIAFMTRVAARFN